MTLKKHKLCLITLFHFQLKTMSCLHQLQFKKYFFNLKHKVY